MLSFLRFLFKKDSKNKLPPNEAVNNLTDDNNFSVKEKNLSRILFKEATQLKKENQYGAACRKLEEAFSAASDDEIVLKDRMRLPMYLQLAGKNDEAWQAFNELNVTYIDVFSQAELANQMRIFLQKEKNFRHALLFESWAICKELVRDNMNIFRIHENADMYSSMGLKINFDEKTPLGYTKKGNPIFDSSLRMFEDRISSAKSSEVVEKRIERLVSKSNMKGSCLEIASTLSNYLSTNEEYKLDEVKNILQKFD